MSRINHAPSAQKTTILSAVSSFVGMMVAVPVALAIFSAGQPANAMQTQNPQGDAYAQYAKAYTEGYLANSDQSQPTSCSEVQTEASQPAAKTMAATATSYHAKDMHHKHHKMMAPAELTKVIKNSYNMYTSNKTEINTKNINSNNTIGSNNTTSSSVSVSDSNGAVVSNNTATNGSNMSHTDVNNVASNNTSVINDSFNKDSHDKTVIVKDSGNTTTTNTTNNTSIINDSFNHEDKTLNVNSNNTIKNHTEIKVEDKHMPHHV